jgi:hypothetical protein
MRDKFNWIHSITLILVLLFTHQYSFPFAQEPDSSKNRFNLTGANNKQARFFMAQEAVLAMFPSQKPGVPAKYDEGYKDSLFFASSLDGGVRFVTKVLRAGGLANSSQALLAKKDLSSAEELRNLLLDQSRPVLSSDKINIPTVICEVNVGTAPGEWPESAKNGKWYWNTSWYLNHPLDPSFSSVCHNLHIAIIYDKNCEKPISAGIVSRIEMGAVRDDIPSIHPIAKLFMRPPSIQIYVNGSETVDFSGSDLKCLEIFNVSSGRSQASKNIIAANLDNDIKEMVRIYADFHTGNLLNKDISRAQIMLNDFDIFLKWSATVIGSELREKVISNTIKMHKDFEFFKEDKKYQHLITAHDKYLQIMRSANESDFRVAPELNGTPDTSPEGMNTSTDNKNKASKSDMAKKVMEKIVDINVDKAVNSKNVKDWVDAKIAESIKKNPNIPASQKNILITLEQSLENESKLIVNGAVVAKSLLLGLDIFSSPSNNERALEEIRDFARKGDPYSAWKTTITKALDMASDAIPLPAKASIATSVMSSKVGERLADATVDIYVPLGNRIAWFMWENGYSPNPPRFDKNQFVNGVKRTATASSPTNGRPIPTPTVPAVPNGVPGPSEAAPTIPTKPPVVVPPNAGSAGTEIRPIPRAGIQDSFGAPFVPVVTPVPLPPPIFTKQASK